ncbi:hypothetical protein AX16_000167 [Volvariella volvacea WC 439]|nr:hypothetical protein AX16_000167 [Volvariella volvacea WC 439]
MSRHRDFRKLDINAELEDDALSDGGEDEITPDQYIQLDESLEQVRKVIGDAQTSGLSDQELKDRLWEWYFNVESTIRWAFGPHFGHHLPPIPFEQQDSSSGSTQSNLLLSSSSSSGSTQTEPVLPRMPLIHLAQQRMQQLGINQDQEDYASTIQSMQPLPSRRPLSVISERTERTQTDPYHRPESSVSSYGRVIAQQSLREQPLDPNAIPPSPSASALHRMSIYEPAPSNRSSPSRTPSPTHYRPPSVPVPDSDEIPEIPEVVSSANPPEADQPPPVPPKKSKLSSLASARSASTKSESTRGSGLTVTGSIKTYPVVRPSTRSAQPIDSAAHSDVISELESVPSSVASAINRAIQTAMQAEPPIPPTPQSSRNSASTADSKGPITTTQSPAITSAPSTVSQTESQPSRSAGKPLSKLAKLAQAKAESSRSHQSLTPSNPLMAKIGTPPRLPPERTEILTPVANGPTVTTAITTSYQSLYSLVDPSRPAMIPALSVVPLSHGPVQDTQQSKLAQKIKKKYEKQASRPIPETELAASKDLPIFDPSLPSRSRASPSAFASVLLDDTLTPLPGKEKHAHKHSKDGKADGMAKAEGVSGRHHEHKHRSRKHRSRLPSAPENPSPHAFKFDEPSPDDIVFNARRGTSLAQHRTGASGTRPSHSSSVATTAKEREKAQKAAAQKKLAAGTASGSGSRTSSPLSTPKKPKKTTLPSTKVSISGYSTPTARVDQRQLDLSALHITPREGSPTSVAPEELPKVTYAREKLLEEVSKAFEAENGQGKKGINLVIIGHVDAGKSTLMGRLLYELGRIDEKAKTANERGAGKVGKASFSWAWGLDGTAEERERGITMDIAMQHFSTSHRQITILDAPGHREFIPNMISGATQADCALLVVDASTGEFEAGFDRAGQTREHLILVRSLGVTQVIVAINKLDMVQWDRSRYDDIVAQMKPFLVQTGFQPSKTKFVPVGAMQAVNLLNLDGEDAKPLRQWYKGPTLIDFLDQLEPPSRDITAPLRIPLSNVFKGQGSSTAVLGRICGGVVQVGERLRILPGDETALVRMIEIEDQSAPWAAAGSACTLHLTSIDPIHLNVGSVLCLPNEPVPLVSSFTAKIIVFDIQVPITAGTSVELFHQSRDLPATISKLHSTTDKSTGKVLKLNPRVLTKGASAEVQIDLRISSMSGSISHVKAIPLELFSVNKDMGRILIRRGGETIAAGVVVDMQMAG